MTRPSSTKWKATAFLALSVAILAGWTMDLRADEVTTTRSVATRLVDAAEATNWELVKDLIDNRDDVNAAQPDGMTALHWAVHHGHAETVTRLLAGQSRKEVDLDAATEYGVTPLSIACEMGNEAIAKQLLEAGADVETVLPGKITPLLLAARTGNSHIVQSLIDQGAKIDATENRGQTPLMWAAAEGNVDAVKVLIAAGADRDAHVKSGFNAMMFATRQGHHKVVRTLLDAGVDVNDVMEPKTKGKRVPRSGTSALTLAVESGHFELAMLLIAKGADPNDQRSGYAPLHAMSWVRKPNRGEEPDGDPPPRGSGNLTSLPFVRALVATGANVNLQLEDGKGGKAFLNQKGASPILLAAKTADLPLLKLLVELGGDATIPNVDGCMPLMAAAGVGVRAVGEEAGTEPEVIASIAFLLEHGNDVNAVDKNKETAMHGAGYRCFPRLVEFLVEHGAETQTWNHKNVSGWTPVMIAQGHRPGSFKPHPETVNAMEAAMGGQAGTADEHR